MSGTKDYIPVPVEAAREVARRYGKCIVVIAAYDREHAEMHITTYGDGVAEKAMAAAGGERVAAALGMPPGGTTYEDFRTIDAAKRALAIEQLTDACRAAMHLCRCMDGRRDLPTDAQIREVGDACEAAIKNAEGC